MGGKQNQTPGWRIWIAAGASCCMVVVGHVATENAKGDQPVEPATHFIFYGGSGEPPDNDCLPDAWERRIVDDNPRDAIRNVHDVLPGDDYDGDGLANRNEYLQGTDPTIRNNADSTILLVVHQPGRQ